MSKKEPKIKPDWIVVALGVFLLATLSAYFTSAIAYPYGWIVLMAMLVMRLMALRNKE